MRINLNILYRSFIKKETIHTVIVGIYIILWIYAASSKLLDYQITKLQMSRSPIITDYAFILAWLVPSIELFITILLFIPRTILIGLYGSLGLMCVFTVYIFFILNYSDFIPCSCGGIIQSLGWKGHLIFNIVFILIAILDIVLQTKVTGYKSNISD